MQSTYKLLILAFTAFCLLLSFPSNAQDFVYKPLNPAFGGDTFNYQWLLSSANEQNKFTEESSSLLDRNTVDDFEENLNRQILSQLSRELVGNVFGEEGLEEGTFEIGSFTIDVTSVLEGISISILNTDDGSETTVVVPFL